MTDLQGISRRDGSGKQVFQSNRMIVRLIIYDAMLLKSLPDSISNAPFLKSSKVTS